MPERAAPTMSVIRHPIPGRALWLRRLGYVAAALVSVIGLTLVLFCRKVLFATLDLVNRGLQRLRFVRWLELHATTTAVICSSLSVILALPVADVAFDETLGAQAVRFATLLALFTMAISSASKALEIPSALDGVGHSSPSGFAESYFAARMTHREDGAWVRATLILSLLVIPTLIGVLLTGGHSAFHVILYVAMVAVSAGRLDSLEHNNSHNQLFRGGHRNWADRAVFRAIDVHSAFILPILFARIPRWYEVQHVVVHHAEDNGLEDTQSTLGYDRASYIDFARCATKFAFSGLLAIDVVAYLIRKRRTAAIIRLVEGMAIFYAILALVAVWHWEIAALVVALRYATQLTTAMVFFQEHGLVDTTTPTNIYRNSLHFVSCSNSHGSLGDDVHIEHHLHQSRHWSNYARDAEEHSENYAREGALGFRDSPGSPADYYRPVWRRDFLTLAERFIVFGRPNATREEIAEVLWARTRPLHEKGRSPVRDRLDLVLGKAAGSLLLE